MTPGSLVFCSPLRGGQQSVKSRALNCGLQVCPYHPVLHVSHTAMAYLGVDV